MTDRDRELLHVEEVQAMLGIGRTTVYEMIRRGDLPALRVGRLVRVPRSRLDEWITRNTTGGAGEAA